MRFGNRPNFHLLITVDWLQSAAILKNHLEKSKPTLDPSPPTAGHGCSLLLYWPCDLCWKVLPLSVSTELHWLCSPVSCSQNINAFTEAEVRAALISSLSSEVIQPLVDLKVCLLSLFVQCLIFPAWWQETYCINTGLFQPCGCCPALNAHDHVSSQWSAQPLSIIYWMYYLCSDNPNVNLGAL